MVQINFVVITSYLDGEKFGEAVTNAADTPIVENNYDLNIGGQVGHDSNRWVGGIDDIRLWNVVRTQGEIAANYNTTFKESPSGLVFNIDFENSSSGNFSDNISGLQGVEHGNVVETAGAPIEGGSTGIYLDGTGYLSVQDPGTDSVLDLGTDFTIEAWYQFGFNTNVWDANLPWGGSQHATILAKNYSHPVTNISYGMWRYSESDNTDNLALQTWQVGWQEYQYYERVGSAFVTGISSDTDWHHIAFTYNSITLDTGTLSINGDGAQNNFLTAFVSGAQDLSGVSGFTLAYQWLRNGIEIAGATDTTYLLTQDDVSTQISVRFSYADSFGNEEIVVSQETASIQNVNDAPVASADVTVSAAENIAAGTTLATASAADVDASTTLTYSISAGNSDGLFAIDGSTGAITLASGRSLDYEVQTQHALTITASDGLLTDTQDITINVTNVSGDVINGTTRADSKAGTTGNDDIYGLAGNDTLEGKAGNDLLDGGIGTDTASYASSTSSVVVDLRITGSQNTRGAGWDKLVSIENLTGGLGSDILTGNALANVINGGSGDDVIDGGAGNDTLIGGVNGSGGDTLSYASATGGIKISLASTSAQITGGAGTDTVSQFENLIGSDYNDNLTGSTGNNSIFGGNGADTITGGSGKDLLFGGEGADVFVFTKTTDSTVNSSRDQIFDFELGDKINLSAIDANSSIRADQAFTFIGSNAFTGLGQLHYVQINGVWILEGNSSGTLAADFQIQINNGYELHASDFIL